MMDHMLGSVLDGRYLLEALIGVGGMANVYKGFDKQEQRVVAIKMLRDEYAGNDDFLRRFRNESKAISTLNHPCIVKIYDVIFAQNPSIVMEFVDGVTLKEFIERKKPLSPKVSVALALQLMTALQHAHDNGIVHRDVKPQNVMVTRDGSIKVMDFGIARFAMSQSRTITDSAIGSVHYISPEQAKGGLVVDHRADIYSAGIILYEMLTGRVPFEGDSPISVAIQQIEDRPLRPRTVDSTIPKALEDITMKAIAKDPDRRYQTAEEMLRDLRRYSDNPQVVFGYADEEEKTAMERAEKQAGGREGSSRGEGRPGGQDSRDGRGGRSRKQSEKKVTFLSVLFGTTCAFVAGTLVFLAILLIQNKPFSKVPEVDMPNLVGMNYNDVTKNRAYGDFKFEIEAQEFNQQYERGVIFDQTPTSGKRVKEGITIKVRVSTGAQTVTLSDFASQEATLVYAKLTEMGVLYTFQEEFSDTVASGNVIRTDPGKNETIPAGSTVTVYVSKGSGKPKVVVPDVVGQDLEYARELLANNGLVISVKYEASIIVPDTVLYQAPGSPARVDEGSTVYVTVSTDSYTTGSGVSVLVLMPQSIEETMTLTAVIDGVEVYNELVVPFHQRSVKVPVSGTGVCRVDIYLGGKLLQSNQVDFEEGTSPKIVDNLNQFE